MNSLKDEGILTMGCILYHETCGDENNKEFPIYCTHEEIK